MPPLSHQPARARVDAELESLRSMPLRTSSGQTVKLSDICTFADFYTKESESVSRYNGNETVMLSITKQDSAVAVDTCRAIVSVLERCSVDGVEFQVIYNEGDRILDTLGEVLETLIIGVLCTMVVLFLFFGELRASLIVGLSMPLSILLAVICMNYGGFSIDLMTGSGLVIAIGMIVDNSIVVMESCMRSRSMGLELKEAAVQGTSSMLMSILGGTLTTVVVYIPLAKLEVMDERVTEIEETLLTDENFEKVILQLSDNTAAFTVYADEASRRSSEEAVELYTERFGDSPGMEVSVSPTSSGSNMGTMMSGNSKDIKLVGDDLETLKEGADMVAEAMTQVPGVIGVENDFDQSRVKGRIVVNSQKALAAGTTEAGVAAQISYLLNGLTATELEYGDTEYDVIVEYPTGKYESITDLLEYPITTQSGQIVTLRDIAEVEYVTTLPSISREDGHYTATITATTTESGKSSASAQIDAAVRELALPEGVSTAMTMMDKNTGEQTFSLGGAIAAAIFLVFLVMAIQFESPKLSLMVMMCIPLSLIGSIGFMFICGRDMSMTKDMSYIVIGGLAASTILAMFLMPAFYLLIRGERLDGTKRRSLLQRLRTGTDKNAAKHSSKS